MSPKSKNDENADWTTEADSSDTYMHDSYGYPTHFSS